MVEVLRETRLPMVENELGENHDREVGLTLELAVVGAKAPLDASSAPRNHAWKLTRDHIPPYIRKREMRKFE